MKTGILLSTAVSILAMSAPGSAAPSQSTIKRTEIALVQQISCRATPQVARAINSMLKNKLIRYVANESGIYLFVPNVPVKFLGFQIKHISGFDRDSAFDGVPFSRMIGTAPPQFIQIDVVAPSNELKKRALAAGLVEGIPSEGKLGFELEDLGSYLAVKSRSTISSIECAD